MATSSEWQALLNDIKSYYGDGSDVYADVAKYGVAADNFAGIIKQLPGWTVTETADGTITGYSRALNYNIASQVGTIDSNAQTGTASRQLPSVLTGVTAAGTAAAATGASITRQTGSNVGRTIMAVGLTLNAVAAAANGFMMAGKAIKKAGSWLTNWVTNHPTLFSTVVSQGGTGGNIVGVPALIDVTDNQGYIEEQSLAKIVQAVASDPEFIAEYENYYDGADYLKLISTEINNTSIFTDIAVGTQMSYRGGDSTTIHNVCHLDSADGDVKMIVSVPPGSDKKHPFIHLWSLSPFTSSTSGGSASSARTYNFLGTTYYYRTHAGGTVVNDPIILRNGAAYVGGITSSGGQTGSTLQYIGVLAAHGVKSYPNKASNYLVQYDGGNVYFCDTSTGGVAWARADAGAYLGNILMQESDSGDYSETTRYAATIYDNILHVVAVNQHKTTLCRTEYTSQGTTVYYNYYQMTTTLPDDASMHQFIPALRASDYVVNFAQRVCNAYIQGIIDGLFDVDPDVDISSGGNDNIIDRGTTISIDSSDDLTTAINKLREQLPDAYSNRVEVPTIQNDGTATTTIYIPVPWNIGSDGTTMHTPTNDEVQNSKIGETTIADTDGNAAPADYGDTGADIAAQGTTQPQTQPATPQPDYTIPATTTDYPNTGSGDTPAIVVPTVQPSSLWTVYNPTLEQVNNFGKWLWSSDFIDQLLKVFSDPMSAIIGFHEIYAAPTNGDDSTIHVGYLDSGVTSKTVAARYGTVDCGTVDLTEYFGNVFDYDPYTQITLYLPFIGFVPLAVSDVMRSTVGIKYNVDFYTGACVALVSVARDGAGGVLYQYSGNCAAQIPLSSGSYVGIVSGVLGIAGSVATGIASGGASIPLSMLGAARSVGGIHTTVQRGGSFAGSAGAMSIKTPYLVISRPQVLLADNFSEYVGIPSNKTVAVGDCTGYVKFDTVHLENVPATGDELSEIEDILTTGVIV